jgi:hypothetical protein
MKKWLIALLSSVILVLPVTSVPSFAAEVPASSTINNGLIINGRVLVPLRAVTENLGASLEWFQADKSKMTNQPFGSPLTSTVSLLNLLHRRILQTLQTLQPANILTWIRQRRLLKGPRMFLYTLLDSRSGQV